MFRPISERPHPAGRGIQKIYRFPNGFGASVVRFRLAASSGLSKSYGSYTDNDLEWEVAVIKFDSGRDDSDYDLVYTTPITDDVIGHVPVHLLEKLLLHISLLNKAGDYRGVGSPGGLGDYR